MRLVKSMSFYKWHRKYGGIGASLVSEMKAMTEEKLRLKEICANEHAEGINRVSDGGRFRNTDIQDR